MASKSSTSVGGGRAPSGASKAVAKSAGGAVRQRTKASTTSSKPKSVAAGSSGMLRFYTEDSPGIKVGPVPVMVMSILFIASVFLLHIWGKYSR
ncbi:protein transport protein Sec61 subunit beta-like [Corticium candelabrum]|uniref:protein transport protein Sec61 subunit beta-like n=1 Tax=Corticium candelabrum TaxID=121492 RepID=UPI002E2626C4|nr:protein transport protein Sec61 subunit beta-like [Corticium candelabrum]